MNKEGGEKLEIDFGESPEGYEKVDIWMYMMTCICRG